MAAFDTNVLIRILVGDDPAQTKRAERAFVSHAEKDDVFVSLLTVAEIAWVLAIAYQWCRETIGSRLGQLARTRGVVFEDLELVNGAIEEYLAGNADLADYLILGKARAAGHVLLTFDKKLARAAGAQLL